MNSKPQIQPVAVNTVTQKAFVDASKLDKKIPPNLIMKYQGQYYILYAGLLWKAYQMFSSGFGIETEIVEHKPDYALVKAILTTANGMRFSNFGESSNLNVTNPMMKKYMLHLAITRASARVLRAATACGFASYEEVFEGNNGEKNIPTSEKDAEKPTPSQLDILQKMKVKEVPKTYGEARQMIAAEMEKK